MNELQLTSPRMRRAQAGKRVGKSGFTILWAITVVLVGGGATAVVLGHHWGWSLLGGSLLTAMLALWWKRDLSAVPVAGRELSDRLDVEVLRRLSPREAAYSPASFWQAIRSHWQAVFFTNHLLLPADTIASLLTKDPATLPTILSTAAQLADATHCEAIEIGHLTAALILTNPDILGLLTATKLGVSDVAAVMGWLGHDLETIRRPRQSFGGIGRDWASGFTPRLDRFGHNLSLSIERSNAHFGSLVDSPGVLAIKAAFSQGAAAIALIGPDGIGKTSHAYALAQNLLAETTDRKLEHKQIVALSPTTIISAAQRPGELEFIVTSLLNEAAHAGNIILFMDDAQLFFTNAPGAFNATQILLPAIQSRRVQFVLAMSPNDYQQLKSTNLAFAGLLMPVVLQEPPEAAVLQTLTDNATTFEIRHKVLITYAAIKEAYRLSGRYDNDAAYPGRAIRLLERSLAHGDNGVITPESVQRAIEQTTGVKAGAAAPIEADALLHLEDSIHQRMINQTRAVSVVANALRRARAGVASPNRPLGSFLFLGPTGVGKTELAKSIAATYFHDEANMIRLDMSEYQQQSDVARLLSTGAGETSSLILRIREKPFSVVLLDEIEKAHPNILNLLLQLLDEGQLTDVSGRVASFKDAIVIATSNAGADAIRQRIEQGQQLEEFEREFIDQLINSGAFKPELLNRFDEIVLFRPLNETELAQVVRLMLAGINKTLAAQNITVELTDAAVSKIVAVGNDPRLGARPMRRALQRAVEDTVAQKILRGEAHPGDHIRLDAPDLTL